MTTRLSARLMIGGLLALPCVSTAGMDDDLATLAANLRTCTATSTTQPHPLMKGFTIEHAVAGPRDDLCEYRQTMPGDMTMVCAFDDAARDAYAEELERTAQTGQISGSSSGSQPAWASACEIETRDGKRIPFGG